MAAISMVACSGNTDNTQETDQAAAIEATTPTGKIAYVEVDSLMSQYQFAKDFTIILTRKGENIQNTLGQKEQALQQQAAAMQKKYESGGFGSTQELQAAQQDLSMQQQNLQALGERLSADFATEQAKYNKALRDSLQSFLREYNKSKKYDYILSRAGDNMLYANPHHDITNEIISGLNKRYKPTQEFKDILENK